MGVLRRYQDHRFVRLSQGRLNTVSIEHRWSMDISQESTGRETGFFRPFGAWVSDSPATHSLRGGLHSCAAARLRFGGFMLRINRSDIGWAGISRGHS
jgi:hypothetical protein